MYRIQSTSKRPRHGLNERRSWAARNHSSFNKHRAIPLTLAMAPDPTMRLFFWQTSPLHKSHTDILTSLNANIHYISLAPSLHVSHPWLKSHKHEQIHNSSKNSTLASICRNTRSSWSTKNAPPLPPKTTQGHLMTSTTHANYKLTYNQVPSDNVPDLPETQREENKK